MRYCLYSRSNRCCCDHHYYLSCYFGFVLLLLDQVLDMDDRYDLDVHDWMFVAVPAAGFDCAAAVGFADMVNDDGIGGNHHYGNDYQGSTGNYSCRHLRNRSVVAGYRCNMGSSYHPTGEAVVVVDAVDVVIAYDIECRDDCSLHKMMT